MLLIFSIDGMRPDGLQQAETPCLDHLVLTGSSTMRAQTVMPCCTLPCHTSMLRGVDTPRHGITTNTFHPLVRPVPSVLDWASSHGMRCGMFFNWGPLRDLCEPESIVSSKFYNGCTLPGGDDRVTEYAIASLGKDNLDLAFIYLGNTDEVGHTHGWMSGPYLEAIAVADSCVARVLDANPAASVLVLSDHGGHERTHGTLAPEDMTIPYVMWGSGVREGYEIQREVVIYDTAVTAATMLGLQKAREWEGTAVTEALL